MLPRIPLSAKEILASATPAPPKKVPKPRQRNPFSSNENLAEFLHQNPPAASTSTSISDAEGTGLQTSPSRPYSVKFTEPYRPRFVEGHSKEQESSWDAGFASGDTGWSDTESLSGLDSIFPSTPSSPINHTSSPEKKTRVPRSQHVEAVLQVLRDHWLSPFDLIIAILDDSNPQYSQYRHELYKKENRKLGQIFDHICSNPAGHIKFEESILSRAVDLVCATVSSEIDAVKDKERLPGLSKINPDFILGWNVSSHQETAPVLFQLLVTAAESAAAKEKNKKKSPVATCNIIIKQLAFQRSNRSLGFPGMFGLFLWTTGCQRQTIEALHRCGLSVSYTSVLEVIESIAKHCMDLAKRAGAGLHAVGYDNVNLSTSIFTEQRGSLGPAKVTSGTFAVLYGLRNAEPEHMKLAPILERFKNAPELEFNRDIRPTRIQLESSARQFQVIIVNVLTTYCEEFKSYIDHPSLQHKPRRPMPDGYITQQYPTRVSTIEEASTEGNLLFHDELYLNQLERDPEQLSEYAIPTYNDQLTNSRIRSGQIIRSRDLDPWNRRQVFQLGISLFHLCLNLVWLLLHVHRGSLDQTGSLTYFFALLEKTRLGGEHPDYHSLLSAMLQILHGLLLNAWRCECGSASLKDYAATNPTPEDLLQIAQKILRNHATPMPTPAKSEDLSDGDSGGSDSDEPNAQSTTQRPTRTRSTRPTRSRTNTQNNIKDPSNDIVHQNIRLLIHDLLYVAELIQAISDGDIGRVEDILPQLAMIFRGAGGNNYCTEILHFIYNLRHVWTPEFADIMRDNMLVNMTGQKGHAMAIDLNIEHLIGELKGLLEAKGLKSTWDRLGNISAAIDFLKKAKKKVATSMNTTYQSMNHTKVETDHLVFRVRDTAGDSAFEKFIDNRPGNSKMIAVISTLLSGGKKIKYSTIGTYNKKMQAMKNGLFPSSELLEVDTLPPVALAHSNQTEGS